MADFVLLPCSVPTLQASMVDTPTLQPVPDWICTVDTSVHSERGFATILPQSLNFDLVLSAPPLPSPALLHLIMNTIKAFSLILTLQNSQDTHLALFKVKPITSVSLLKG